MGRRLSCEKKSGQQNIRNMTECQRSFIAEKAEIASIHRGYRVTFSAMVKEIISEYMRSEHYACLNQPDSVPDPPASNPLKF
jgi:hypothetical protein